MKTEFALVATSIRSFLCACSLALVAASAQAGSIEKLHAFIEQTRSARADFTQEVVDSSGSAQQKASGTVQFQRPGKFRWAYEKPYEQLIVGDGEKVWVFDRDLNQVIVRKLDVALGANPAALLAGDNALEKNFDLTEAGTNGGLEWIAAQRKAPDSGLEYVRIGFRDNLPRAMELKDAFANVTTLTFTAFDRNPSLDAAQFR